MATKREKLTETDRQAFNEYVNALDLTQRQLAEQAGVTQSWLSQSFTGRSASVDAEKLEKVANLLISLINQRQPDSRLSADRAKIALSFLSRFSGEAMALAQPQMMSQPGDVVAFGDYYVTRSKDAELLQMLECLPFSALVMSAPQCGTSSLLAHLESKAREQRVECAWWDPKRMTSGLTAEEISEAASLHLYRTLQAQWGLKPSRDGEPNSITLLFHWLMKELASTAATPRLLIMDDLASLGAGELSNWLSNFVRAIDTTRPRTRMNLSIVVGITHHFEVAFHKRMLELSSIVHWRPNLELDWFTDEEMKQIERAITGKNDKKSNLFELFGGQPYLTHAALTDKPFYEAVRNWDEAFKKEAKGDLAEPSAETLARPILGSRFYKKHRKAISSALCGSSRDSNSNCKDLIRGFYKACSTQRDDNKPDQKVFFERVKLLKNNEPRISLYRLIAEDLFEEQ